jgi:hypothetical protein
MKCRIFQICLKRIKMRLSLFALNVSDMEFAKLESLVETYLKLGPEGLELEVLFHGVSDAQAERMIEYAKREMKAQPPVGYLDHFYKGGTRRRVISNGREEVIRKERISHLDFQGMRVNLKREIPSVVRPDARVLFCRRQTVQCFRTATLELVIKSVRIGEPLEVELEYVGPKDTAASITKQLYETCQLLLAL